MATKDSTTLREFINSLERLAEILPLESADMSWVSCDDGRQKYYQAENKKIILMYEKKHWIPCWSLAALMKIIEIDKSEICFDCYGEKYRLNVHYQTLGSFCQDNELYESKIDACVAMIIKLHKRNLL